MNNKISKLLALGGLAGPVLFTFTTIINGFNRPGYDHLNQFISELGATGTTHANLMNFLGFLPSGILVTCFGISLFLLLPNRWISKIGTVLIFVFGIGMFLAGIFSCDEGCPLQGSLESTIHDRISAIAFISVIIGTITLGFSFLKTNFLKKYGAFAIISGFMAALFLALMLNSFDTKIFTGLWQRLLLVAIFSWMAAVGLYLFRAGGSLNIERNKPAS